MILRRYHRPPDVDDDQAVEQPAAEQTESAPQANKPAGRSAAPSKAKKTGGG
ncbi:hypothetical protein GCM10018980_25470 [Streptomyces capoamus]|uniref:Uncharacterized protein n=1 Tax=Streptomyces capoamus TaxID=68183 RepID=A0A919C4M8_9ACTN|nr:hypothetical protein [Streptomyces capoamus]GGW19869.1 hypothetical protein GCM10010501_60250 [Streptomyces libani subsp. rufus]GHG46465.1 hypothetical protein GCM10018980_25470 [Streptomyces capoamus]